MKRSEVLVTPPSAIGGPAPLEEGKNFVLIGTVFSPSLRGSTPDLSGGGSYIKLNIISYLAFEMNKFKANWKENWNQSQFRIQFVLTFVLLGILLFSLSYFFAFVEAREGKRVGDVVLNLVQPFDVSVFTFLLIYSAALLCIGSLVSKPDLFLKAVQAYFLILIFRIVSLSIFPLEAPEGIIPLTDPFIEHFFYGQVRITKDLFFSGHVATVCLLYLVNPIKKLNWFYLTVAILVSLLIMIQRVHYSFDVFAAPFFAWMSYKLSDKISGFNASSNLS